MRGLVDCSRVGRAPGKREGGAPPANGRARCHGVADKRWASQQLKGVGSWLAGSSAALGTAGCLRERCAGCWCAGCCRAGGGRQGQRAGLCSGKEGEAGRERKAGRQGAGKFAGGGQRSVQCMLCRWQPSMPTRSCAQARPTPPLPSPAPPACSPACRGRGVAAVLPVRPQLRLPHAHALAACVVALLAQPGRVHTRTQLQSGGRRRA